MKFAFHNSFMARKMFKFALLLEISIYRANIGDNVIDEAKTTNSLC